MPALIYVTETYSLTLELTTILTLQLCPHQLVLSVAALAISPMNVLPTHFGTPI